MPTSSFASRVADGRLTPKERIDLAVVVAFCEDMLPVMERARGLGLEDQAIEKTMIADLVMKAYARGGFSA